MRLLENRQTPRRRTFKGGKILFNQSRSAIDCTVKNISAGGAALLLESTIGVPDTFDLIINPDRVAKVCRTIWKTDTLLGVEFTIIS